MVENNRKACFLFLKFSLNIKREETKSMWNGKEELKGEKRRRCIKTRFINAAPDIIDAFFFSNLPQ